MNKYSFNRIKLREFIDIITDYHANGSYKTLKENVTLKYQEDYAIMIRTLNFEANNFTSNLIYINKDAYEFLSKSKVFENDIIMNKIANPGSVYRMPKINKPVSLAMNLFLIRFNKTLNQVYMYYLMKTNEHYIKKFINGTTTKTITKDAIKDLVFYVPKKNIQDKIASILSTIDKKIELNNKINQKLEAMTKAIYDYWFVQFDFPDANDKPYKSSNGKMVYNEELKREIPEGWEVVFLEDALEFKKGIEPGSKNYKANKINSDYIPFYKVADMNGEVKTYIDKKLVQNALVKEDDILVSFDGTVGKVAIGLNGSFSSGMRKIYQKNKYFPKCFVYEIFKSSETQQTIKKYATGSNILHASSSISNLKIPYHEGTVKKFDSILFNPFKKIILNIKQNQKLSELRDWLLPMLMNGQVTVSEAQEMVEELMAAEPSVEYGKS